MKGIRRILSTILLTACFLCGAVTVFSQGTDLGTIRGTVTDPNKAAVVGATVRVTDVGTNISRDLTTDGQGNYEAANLKTGTYTVTVNAQGFKTEEIRDVVLRTGDTVRADARLQIGVSETVQITSAPTIETEVPTISGTLSDRQLIEVPRDSRDVYEFLYLNPNITQSAGGDGTFKFIGAQSYGASFSLDGQRSNSVVFGEPSTSQPSLESIGELTVMSNNFTAEYAGIQNIRVETKRGTKDYHGSLFYNNKNSALAARKLDDKIAEAESFIPTPNTPVFPTPYFNLNETGGSFGGPVPFFDKNKTFFFTSYERRWDVGQTNFTSTRIPGPRLLMGDFTQLKKSARPVVPANILSLLTPAEIAANTIDLNEGTGNPPDRRFLSIPQRLINPTTNAIIQTYFPQLSPLTPISSTTGRVIQFFQNVNNLTTRDLATFRVDRTFSNKNSVYAVYNYQNNPHHTGAAANPLPGFGLRRIDRTNHTLALSFTHLFSSKLVNEARGGFNLQREYIRNNQTVGQFLSSIGFDQSDLAAYGSVVGSPVLNLFGEPAITLGSFGTLVSNGGRSADRPRDQNNLTFGDTISWTVGRHALKMGFDIVHNHGKDGFVQNRGQVRGLINYGGTGPNALARFLLGQPATTVGFVLNRRPILDVTNWEQGYYVQDDFKIRPRLTLNLGLRYEYISPFIDKNNLMVNFDPNFVDPTTKRRGRFIVPTSSVIPAIDPRMVTYGVVTADQLGLGRGLVRADKTNFAPRVGFAWRMTEKTVLRGGYGLFYPTAAAQGIRDALESSPFNQGLTKDTRGTPLQGWPGGLNGHGISPVSGGRVRTLGLTDFTSIAANAIPFNLHQPRIEQYNITLERELGFNTGLRVSYLGTRMRRLIGGIDLNEIPPNDIPFATTTGDGVTPCDPINNGDCALSDADIARLPFPELSDFLASYGNNGKGRSNALQIEVTRRFSRGLLFDASYTLLDQKSTVGDQGDSSLGEPTYNQFASQLELSRDSFVSRHRFVAHAIYDLPFGHGRKFGAHASKLVDWTLGGWQLSTAMFAKSGIGFTPYFDCDNCFPPYPGNTASSFPDATGGFNDGTFRPRLVGNPYAGATGDQIFNPAAFAPPSVGSDVFNSGIKRQIVTGPSTWSANLGVRKNFKLTERATLNVGALFDNIFNHPLLSTTDPTDQFAHLGTIHVTVDPNTRKVGILYNPDPVNGDADPNFGRLNRSFAQEGFDSRRSIRLTIRLTF